ncbi:hypothetical protein G7061_09240 [Erysipelothrix sp. HDW6B]|nr:hypothetical protein [Erysipelothrix sp. HDW6B]QIK86785.1 hypothetical protein G7061_09240 [Erysipelothrix sp. HDW6B]
MQKMVDAEGLAGMISDMVIDVNGFDITVRGMIVDGIFKIGTFFIT